MQIAAAVAAAAGGAADAASNRTPNASPTPPTKTTTATLPTTKIASTNPTKKKPTNFKNKKNTPKPFTQKHYPNTLVCWSAPRIACKTPIFLGNYNQNPIPLFCPKPLFWHHSPTNPDSKTAFFAHPICGSIEEERALLGLPTVSQPISPPLRYHSLGFQNRVVDRIVAWCRNTRSCRNLII